MRFPTIEVTKATLAHNTHMVQTLQAETRECVRNHYKTRLWALRSRRIDDAMYLETFFSNMTSIRGYNCFQFFAYKYSKFERI